MVIKGEAHIQTPRDSILLGSLIPNSDPRDSHHTVWPQKTEPGAPGKQHRCLWGGVAPEDSALPPLGPGCVSPAAQMQTSVITVSSDPTARGSGSGP